MWIEKLKNGKFKAVERYTDPMTGKEKKVSVTLEKNTASTRKMATLLLADKIDKKLTGTKGPEKLTFEELVELYLEDKKKTTKASSYKNTISRCNSVLKILGEDTLVRSLNSGYIRRKILDTGKSKRTLNGYLSRIKMIIRWGYRNDCIDDASYVDKIENFKDEEKILRLEDKYLESEELHKLLDGIKKDKWRDLTLFLALTGMRIGEAIVLNINDINLEERTISITKTFDNHNKIITSPKTFDSYRSIYIQDELLPLVKRLKQNALAYKFVSKSSLLFQDEKGMYKYNSYYHHIKAKALDVLGKDISPHVLRHTHTSLLAEQGISLDVISRRLGHGDIKVTKDIYFHVTKKLKIRDNEILRSVSIL